MILELEREKPEAAEAPPADLERQRELFNVDSDDEDDDSDDAID